MVKIYVDADACPVKEEVFRVALRHQVAVLVVANGRLNLPRNPLFTMVVVGGNFDEADDWIVEHVGLAISPSPPISPLRIAA